MAILRQPIPGTASEMDNSLRGLPAISGDENQGHLRTDWGSPELSGSTPLAQRDGA